MLDDFNERVTALITAVILTLLLLFWPQMASASKTTLTGTINDAQGDGINGYLVMWLPVPAQDTTSNVAVSNEPVYFTLLNGAITGGAQLYDTANLQPAGLYYIARAYDVTGNVVFAGNYVVTGGTFNLGAATPTSVTTSNISYLTPAFANGNNSFSGVNTFSNTSTFNGTVALNAATTFTPTLSGPTVILNNLTFNEGTAPTGATGKDICYGDSTAHNIECSFNNGSFLPLVFPNIANTWSVAQVFTSGITSGPVNNLANINSEPGNTDVAGTLAFSGGTTSSTYTFAAGATHVCAISPIGDPGANRIWISSSGTTLQATASAAVTVSFNYICTSKIPY